MSEMVKILIGSTNVAARYSGRVYIGCALPMCDRNGVEWLDMGPQQRWVFCVAHLRDGDIDFSNLLLALADRPDDQDSIELILFGNSTAIVLLHAVQDDCYAKVMATVRVQTQRDIDRDISWFCNKGDKLWNALFEC